MLYAEDVRQNFNTMMMTFAELTSKDHLLDCTSHLHLLIHVSSHMFSVRLHRCQHVFCILFSFFSASSKSATTCFYLHLVQNHLEFVILQKCSRASTQRISMQEEHNQQHVFPSPYCIEKRFVPRT